MSQHRPGMGAIPHAAGVAFRVWAPHARRVFVTGTFDGFAKHQHELASEDNGYWYGDVPPAKIGHEYRFVIDSPAGELLKIDPYARAVTNSIGNGIILDPRFDWNGDDFTIAPWNELVIYELHIGTFRDRKPTDDKPATFKDAISRFDHLKKLGVNCLQVMPIAEFAGDRSWGYNPAHIFAIESAYGGPTLFKEFVKQAHQCGFAVIVDVVYNHLGPSDLGEGLWQFDGWSENGGGGIYFYNDWRKKTPWGDTRPDYGRGEVRQYLRDNALMWLDEFHVDGLRFDMTQFMRTVDGSTDLPDGWGLMQWLNREVRERHPGKLTICEDLQKNDWLTKDTGAGGAGFGSQWDAAFVHPIRDMVIKPSDAHRSMTAVRDAVQHKYNDDATDRVIYTESHDEVANGKARLPQDINPGDPTGWYAQKRSTLAAALLFTAPGIPMLFQGQEFLEGEYFRDTVPVDWDNSTEYRGILKMYRDLVHLRLNRKGRTRGLCGQHVQVYHVNDDANVIAFQRWDRGGPGDAVVVVCNAHHEKRPSYDIGFPTAGKWELLFNSDWRGYSTLFEGQMSDDIVAHAEPYDGYPAKGTISIGAYSVLIFAHG